MGNTALYEQGLERAETRIWPPWLSSILGLHTCGWGALGLLAGEKPPRISLPSLLSMRTESWAKPLWKPTYECYPYWWRKNGRVSVASEFLGTSLKMLWLKCLDPSPTGCTHITHWRGHYWASGHKRPSELLKSGLPSSLSLADYLEKQESEGLWSRALRVSLSRVQRFQRNKSALHWQLRNPGTPSPFIDMVGIGKILRDWSSNNCWLGDTQWAEAKGLDKAQLWGRELHRLRFVLI